MIHYIPCPPFEVIDDSTCDSTHCRTSITTSGRGGRSSRSPHKHNPRRRRVVDTKRETGSVALLMRPRPTQLNSPNKMCAVRCAYQYQLQCHSLTLLSLVCLRGGAISYTSRTRARGVLSNRPHRQKHPVIVARISLDVEIGQIVVCYPTTPKACRMCCSHSNFQSIRRRHTRRSFYDTHTHSTRNATRVV